MPIISVDIITSNTHMWELRLPKNPKDDPLNTITAALKIVSDTFK